MKNNYISLHDWKTGELVRVCINQFSSEGSYIYQGINIVAQPGTMVWWRDERGDSRSAFVKESTDEINELMENSQKINA